MLYPFSFLEKYCTSASTETVILKLKTIKITHLISVLPDGKQRIFVQLSATDENKKL